MIDMWHTAVNTKVIKKIIIIPFVLSVVMFASVVVKAVDVNVVAEIVGSSVVAVFSSGTIKFYITVTNLVTLRLLLNY